MASLEAVDRLRERASVSFDEAKEALDASNDDLLDALIYLEQQGKTEPPKSGGYYSSEGDAREAYDNNAGYRGQSADSSRGYARQGYGASSSGSRGYGSSGYGAQDYDARGYGKSARKAAQKAAHAADKAARKFAEKAEARERRRNARGYQSRYGDGRAGYGNSYGDGSRARSVLHDIAGFLGKALHAGNTTYLDVSRYERHLFSLPLTVCVIALLLFFYATAAALVIGLVCGCRYKITGEAINKL